jgi:hypothetical protein
LSRAPARFAPRVEVRGAQLLSYGVALVCFAVAVVYLLTDGVKTEATAVWSSLFALAVLGA